MEGHVDNNEHFRHILLFAFNQVTKTAKAVCDICDHYRDLRRSPVPLMSEFRLYGNSSGSRKPEISPWQKGYPPTEDPALIRVAELGIREAEFRQADYLKQKAILAAANSLYEDVGARPNPRDYEHENHIRELRARSPLIQHGIDPALMVQPLEEETRHYKRAFLGGQTPPLAQLVPTTIGAKNNSKFGLGLGKYGKEIPSPLDDEIRHSILEMQQELAFIETLPQADNLRHSRRLIKERCYKLEITEDPEWVEVDINKPIKIVRRVLIPIFRNPTYNYVGRILGPKGSIMKKIVAKYKCFVSILGKGSSKDLEHEAELLRTGETRHAHFASPLHVRIDTVGPAHIAHTRVAACLRILNLIFTPGNEALVEEELEDVDLDAPDVKRMVKTKTKKGEEEDTHQKQQKEEEHEEEDQQQNEKKPLYENEYESGDDEVVEIPPPTPTTKAPDTSRVYNGPTKAPPIKTTTATSSYSVARSSTTKTTYNGPTSAVRGSSKYGNSYSRAANVQTRNGTGLFGSSAEHETTNNRYPRESFFNSTSTGVKESHVGNAYGSRYGGGPIPTTNRSGSRGGVPSLASATRDISPAIPPRYKRVNPY